MRKYFKYLMVVFLFGFVMNVRITPVLAAEGDQAKQDQGKPEKETDYSYGTVVRASAAELVVSEYDYETDQDVEVTYALDPAVQLDNVANVSEIQAGDGVDIDFVTKDGKKTALAVAVEKFTNEEEPASEEPAAQPAAPAPAAQPNTQAKPATP